MKIKTFNFYKDLFDFAGSDYLTSPQTCEKFFVRAVGYDFSVAAELWEFLAARQCKDAQAYKLIGANVLQAFYSANVLKTRALLLDCPEIRDAVYANDPKAHEGLPCEIALYYLSGFKIDESKLILGSLSKNVNSGPVLKALLEKTFVQIKNKNDGKLALPKKFVELLLAYTKNIKTAERAVIEQRIREIV